MAKWLKLAVETDEAGADAVSDLLLELGAVSASVAPRSGEVLEPDPQATPLWQQCVVWGLMPMGAPLDGLSERLAAASARVGAVEFVDDAHWQHSWRQHAVTRQIGGRFWLLPRDAPPVDGPALRLDPGLAFGSGSHPTTRLCLEWTACADFSNAHVLDYGCGSGVLALACALLGADQVVAVDHDPQALQATLDNAEFNDVEERLLVGTPEVCEGRTFDVILANILAAPLIELAPRLTAMLRQGGTLVLSGMLVGQADEVSAAYPGVDFDAPLVSQEWVCLVGRCLANRAGSE